MFGFVKNDKGSAVPANRIFEMVLYNLFLSEECSTVIFTERRYTVKAGLLKNGHLDMKAILEKFVTHFDELYGDQDVHFWRQTADDISYYI